MWILGTKTFWAGLVGAAAVLLQADAINMETVLAAVAILLGAIGVRHGISKGPAK